MDTELSVGRRAAGALKWIAFGELTARCASPITTLVLARLLTPVDFGAVSTAMIAIAFGQVFTSAGLGNAIIQTEQDPHDAANFTFWTSILLALAAYSALFLAAPSIGTALHNIKCVMVLRVLGVIFLINSLSSAHGAMLIRTLSFRRLFWVRCSASLTPSLISIPLAMTRCGVWALVAGQLLGAVCSCAVLWHVSTWRLRFPVYFRVPRRLLYFAGWSFLEGLVAWFFTWADNLAVARYLTTHDLGVYAVAWNLSSAAYGLLLNPLMPVVYPTFCRLQGQPEVLYLAFVEVGQTITSLALPIACFFLCAGTLVSTVLFDQRWHDLGFVLSLLGLMQGLGWVVAVNPELYRAIGRPDVTFKMSIATILYYVPIYIVAAPYGLKVFTVGRLVAAATTLPVHVLVFTHIMGKSTSCLLRQMKAPFVASLAMSVVVAFLVAILPAGVPGDRVLSLLACVASATVVYFAALFLLDRSFVFRSYARLRQACRS